MGSGPQYVAFNGDLMRELATEFLALAEKQGATVPLMIGHRLGGGRLGLLEILLKAECASIKRSPFTDPSERRRAGTHRPGVTGLPIVR